MESITGTILSFSGPNGYDANGNDFDILRDLLITADAIAETPFAGIGLVAALDTLPDLTAFAPEDNAFQGLAATIAAVTGNTVFGSEGATVGFLADALTLLGQGDPSELLTDILTYHVAPDIFELSDVIALGDNAAVPTLLGLNLLTDFDTMPASLIDADGGVPNPGIIATDIAATNGVIHVLDGVLLPLPASAVLTQPDLDFVIGDNSGEVIVTKDGNDYIDGNGGDDEINAGYGDDTVIGGLGDDFVAGGAGMDVLMGDLGRDTIMGGRDDDMIYGGAGNDRLSGNAGNDMIKGGAGSDLLFGGGGGDVFKFMMGDGADRIVDFKDGQDMIDLSMYDGIESFADIEAGIGGSGFRSTITLDGGDSITLLGVVSDQLDAGDFIFADTLLA